MKVNYCVLLSLVLAFTEYFCFCHVLHILGQSHNGKESSLPSCNAHQVDPAVFINSDITRKKFSHSASLGYSYTKVELLALILILSLLFPILLPFQYHCNFSIDFPWSKGIKIYLSCF